jgi:hypothetical protein
MTQAAVTGEKKGHGHMTRYVKHIHSFRAFGSVEMQNRNVNKDVIDYLMGHKVTYTEWKKRYNELLEIYRQARPRLDQKEALGDIVEYAKARGYSLDPKDLKVSDGITKFGDIGAGSNPHANSSQGAEASKAH